MKYIQVFVNIVKVATALEQDTFAVDAGSCYADENIESSHAVEQTTCTIIKLPALLSYFEQIRTFRTVGTQTEDLRIQGTARIQPDDINELLHLEDHSYSLHGSNNDPSANDNKDLVEPCPKLCTPVSVDNLHWLKVMMSRKRWL